MSTANNCDCRFKVDWEDLSPTLQARLLKIEKDIVLIKSEISKNKSKYSRYFTKN